MSNYHIICLNTVNTINLETCHIKFLKFQQTFSALALKEISICLK